jgi:hypothetical protein
MRHVSLLFGVYLTPLTSDFNEQSSLPVPCHPLPLTGAPTTNVDLVLFLCPYILEACSFITLFLHLQQPLCTTLTVISVYVVNIIQPLRHPHLPIIFLPSHDFATQCAQLT